MTGFEGWPVDAVALVERAIAAHGGIERWRNITSIRLPFRSGSGPLLTLKGYGRTFPAPRECEVLPHRDTVLFHDYPDAGHRGRFVDGRVSIELVSGRSVESAGATHRETFSGFAKYRRWSPLDAIYFFGYALWHYHVLPFTLGDARLVRVLTPHGVPEGIDVVFPGTVQTHCRRQQFYFAGDGRIVRHDYVADIVGAWARGSHFWEDYDRSQGVLIARRRRVVVRLGRRPLPIPVLTVQLGEPSIQF